MEVRIELRARGENGPPLGEFRPRFTGADTAREFPTTLEPAEGQQRLCLVVRSALGQSAGTISGLRLERSARPIDESGIGSPPLMRDGKPVFPAAINRPQARPNERFPVPSPAPKPVDQTPAKPRSPARSTT